MLLWIHGDRDVRPQRDHAVPQADGELKSIRCFAKAEVEQRPNVQALKPDYQEDYQRPFGPKLCSAAIDHAKEQCQAFPSLRP
jgi:hypothetical protein